MIIRIFQVTTHPGKEAEFAAFFHETAIPLMKRTPGILSIIPGAPRAESPRDFCMVMVWKDLQSLKEFVGEDYDSPHVHPDEAHLVAARRIAHYDLVEDPAASEAETSSSVVRKFISGDMSTVSS